MDVKDTPRPGRRARFFAYLFFGITLLACSGWMIYRYYLIDGWNLWYDYVQTEQPYEWVIRDYFAPTLIILSLVAGLVSGDKKTKAVFLAVCYLYTVTMVWIVPVIWNIDKDITSIRLILEAVIVFGSIFSLCIIPCFAISTFTAWVAKALLIKIKRKKFDR